MRQLVRSYPDAATRADSSPFGLLRQIGMVVETDTAQPLAAVTSSFSDAFAGDANPIGSPWVRTATNFKPVRTTGGAAYAAEYTDNNDDAYALLSSSTFQAPSDNYEVTATWVRNSFGVAPNETEIMLRLSADATSMQGYEVLVNNGGGEIVRLDGGGPGGFVEFNGTNGTPNATFTIGPWEGTGDKIRARVTGTNPVRIEMWHAPASAPATWTKYVDCTDSNALRKQTGQPGIGFYNKTSDGNLLNCGWSDFSVVAV
jgi:hypothetical protein